MRRHFLGLVVVVMVSLFIGFLLGIHVLGRLNNPASLSPVRLVEAIRKQGVVLNSELQPWVYAKPRYVHSRKDTDGSVLQTLVFYDSNRMVILTLTDGKVTEITLWDSRYDVPDVYSHHERTGTE
jgi:hypothetical protein